LCLLNRGKVTPRQTGKTTFLHQLKQTSELVDDWVYIDFEAKKYGNFEEMLCDLGQRVREYYPGVNIIGSHKFLGTLLKELAEFKECVFLIDELCSSREIAIQFLRSIRAYYNECIADDIDRSHRFVVAGSTDLAAFTLEENPQLSPFNIAAEIYLSDFGIEQIQTFVEQNAKYKFSAKAIQQLFDYTNGHPFLIQFLCHNLFDYESQEIERKLEHLPTLLDELKPEHTVNVKNMIDQIWYAPEKSKDLAEMLLAILRGTLIPFSTSHKIIRDLYLNGCIKKTEGGYCAIRNPIYETIIQKNFDIRNKVRQFREREELEHRPKRFEDFFRTLKNFDGWITVSLFEGTRLVPCNREKNLYTLIENGQYTLEIRISKGTRPPEGENFSERLLIKDGEEAEDTIEFGVRLESFYNLNFGEEQSRPFSPHLKDMIQTYRFPIRTDQQTKEPIQVFINIYQDVSLVQIVKLHFQINAR
jgi:hypothetical protein